MAKKLKLWIYEYKDDDTPIGATLIDEFVENIEYNEGFKLPHETTTLKFLTVK